MVKTQSWRGGLHQYTLGHTERVAEVEKSIAAHPGLALAGAALYGIGLNECVESGRRAADAVLSAAIRTAGDGWATEASGKLPSRPGGRP
jgi:protoporphyrinogen oxidase